MGRNYYRMQRRQRAVWADFHDKSPFTRIWQRLCLVAIGTAVFWFFGPTTSYYKVSGRIQAETETIISGTNISLFQLEGSDTLYGAENNAFTPAFNIQIVPGTRVDLYYEDTTPKQIVGLQTYDASGTPSTLYKTADFTTTPPSLLSWGSVAAVLLILFGLAWFGRGIWRWLAARNARNQHSQTLSY